MRSFGLIALLIAFASPAFAAPTPAPTPPGKGDPMAAARKALDEVSDMTYQGRSLNDVINDLRTKSKLNVILDPSVFHYGIDPNQPTVNVSQKDVKVRDGLKAILTPYNLRFGLIREGLYISTEDGVTAKQLKQRVTVDCDGTPFATAAKQLAADTGANVVVDPRLKEKANAGVTLKLDEVPLETAVRLLAEVADLRAVRMSNVLFVTTPERAEKLRPDADGPLPGGNPLPVFPHGLNPPPVPAFGLNFGGLALPAAPPQALPAPPAPEPGPAAEKAPDKLPPPADKK